MTEADPKAITLSLRDRPFLEKAVALGKRGWGRVHPNPLVGCVIVRDERIVGEGWHAEFGGDHAEVAALAAAGDRARGGEAFVSLEPCRHQGKTPPCTDALLAAGVSRVVYGAKDPGSDSGGGGALLEARGISVVGPALSPEAARWENPVFFDPPRRRPWIALKLAVSLDARISKGPGERSQLSGPETQAEVHRLRAGFDAILVGTRTARVDDPRLTVRGGVVPRIAPRRVFLDASGRIGPEARVFREGDGEVWILTTDASSPDWRTAVADVGATILEVSEAAHGRIDLLQAAELLRNRGIRSVLCEGGGEVASSLLEARLVDRLYLAVAPCFLGGEGVPAFPASPSGGTGFHGSEDWTFGEPPRQLGEDLWLALEPAVHMEED
jgi:diaminohydroxyphosphoribosylaminopyrimidine deaminase/5-amino-6-(5-phosphoribosylamino)uracil reductase